MTLFFSKQKAHSSKLLTTYPFLSLPFFSLTFCQWFFWWVLFFTSALASLDPLPSSTPFCCPHFLNSHAYAKKPSLNINQQCKCPILQLSFSLSSQSFFAQFWHSSQLSISLWDAMTKLWCGNIGNEFKRWRVGINKGGGEIDGHKENSQHFRAKFKKGIECSI